MDNDEKQCIFVIVTHISENCYEAKMQQLKSLEFPRQLQYCNTSSDHSDNTAYCPVSGTLPIFHEHFWLCTMQKPGYEPETVCIQLVYLEEYKSKEEVKHCAPHGGEIFQIYVPLVQDRQYPSAYF